MDAVLAEEALYHAAIERVPESRTLHNNTVVDLLAIGSEMLRGEILYRQEKYDEAYAALRRAIVLEDTLPYDEPWGWMQPVRHALGALLLEQGHTNEAEAVCRADRGLDGLSVAVALDLRPEAWRAVPALTVTEEASLPSQQ